jgi:hypothetical protein
MKRLALLTTIILSASYPSIAMTLPWLQQMFVENSKPWSLEQLRQDSAFYDCGLSAEDSEFCTDAIKYYGVEVDARLFVENGLVVKAELTSGFTPSTYTELQLNLRKDGFVLSKAKIGPREFDVLEKLKQDPIKQVNREVVMFLNEGPLTSERTFTWYPNDEYYEQMPTRFAQFESDGKNIRLQFVR